MSFDVNPLNNGIPHQIRTSKSQDGGAGNTGYFQQRKKQEEDNDENSLDRSLFNEGEDTFSLKDAREVAYIEPTFLMKVVEYLKATIKNLFH